MTTTCDERLSVCIPACGRPRELAACLDALMLQDEPPDEIVVSDAGGDAETRSLLRSYRVRHYPIGRCPVRHYPTTRRALPWQRWWAFEHAFGSIVMFIDDDIRLAPDAIARLRAAYREHPDAAGVGFPITYQATPWAYDICDPAPLRDAPPTAPALRERWLGIAGKTRGSITPGGQTVDLPALPLSPASPARPSPPTDEPGGGIVDVDWLSGGAMSFRRTVLDAIGPLHHLFALYDARIGKAEDAILSSRARRHGRLLLIVEPCARHPAFEQATRTANPQDGYRKGLLETWGRAHVLRWLASDPHAAGRAWVRLASLEIARASKAALRRPASAAPWQRLLGDVVGIQRTFRRWHEIPQGSTIADARMADTRAHGPGVTSEADVLIRRGEAAGGLRLMFFWDYDTQWGADRSRMQRARDWGHLEFPGTDELLELHARFGVPACFAVVGAAALPGERPYHDPKQIRRIHAAGHEIASHAFKHEWLPGLDRRALLRTLRDSKDALEQCIGAPVVSFVPPFNQPFHYARGWSFSVSELREAGVHHITLDCLCDALRETGYTFCRVAYAPLTERAAGVADMLRGRDRASGSEAAFRPGPPVTIGGITCVRIGPCGFGTSRVSEWFRRAAPRERRASVVALYGHPHSIRSGDANQSLDALKPTMAMVGEWMREGTVRCVRPSELVAS
jgi:GT2 family glycosyltransferase